jgi:hypothetical protein
MQGNRSMSSSSNQLETMIRAYLDEVFNRYDLSRLGRYMGDDLVSTWLGDRTLHAFRRGETPWPASSPPSPMPPSPWTTSSSPAIRAFGA